jgi:hypothetical protein
VKPATSARSLAPGDAQVNDCLKEGGGSYVNAIISTRPGQRMEGKAPAMPASDDAFTGVDMDHVTGKPTKGETMGRGTF